jgi:hypothetical protein
MNTGVWLESLKEEVQLEDIGIDGKILKRISEQLLCDGDGLDSSQNRN